jgi:hypothetical protein
MLDSTRSFTAVLAFDDLAALGVVRGLSGAGLRVPEDYSVMGFDDVLPAAVATPGITGGARFDDDTKVDIREGFDGSASEPWADPPPTPER